MELNVLNAGTGDYKAEFDTDDERARGQLAEFINDALRKGYALFLEDGEETHRILGYDEAARSFIVRSSMAREGSAKVRVVEQEKPSPEQPSHPGDAHLRSLTENEERRRGGRKRVTAVAPGAGG